MDSAKLGSGGWCGEAREVAGQRVTLPALMQDVHTFIRRGWPETAARTRWMLGFHRRFVFFFDHGTLWPKPGLLPHTSHTAATGVRSHYRSTSTGARPGNLPSVPGRAAKGRIHAPGKADHAL